MKRRNFLKSASLAGLGPLMLNGLPVQTLGGHRELQALANNSDNDRVLVLCQLHGGNDGLNCLVPFNQFDLYNNLRSNIALPNRGNRGLLTLDSGLDDNQQLGVHPDMEAFQRMYDNGRSAVVQSVAYDNASTSHFRSSDVMFMGGGGYDNFASGWTGRYLSDLNPAYPEGYPSEEYPDPLAIEIGAQASLAFHRADGLSTAIAITDPKRFSELASQIDNAPTVQGNKHYHRELEHILRIEQQTDQYAQRISDVFKQGKNSSVVYPEQYPGISQFSFNELSEQFKIVARLLAGGIGTKIFMVRIHGFDTHVQQVEPDDPTRGNHAVLLHNLFGAIEAFQNDLKQLGLEDRVMTLTFSEFGRRVASNANRGTDHGAAAPMFVFGKHVQPGVVGSNADLSDLDELGNLKYQYDYRQVLGTLLKDWMQASARTMNQTRFAAFAEETLPLVGGQPVAPPVAQSQHKKWKTADGVYKLRSVATGQIVEAVVAKRKANNVRTALDLDQPHQRWQVTRIDNVYHRITSVQDIKMCLDASGWGTRNGTNVQVRASHQEGQSNQEWNLMPDRNGYYRLIPRYVEEQSLNLCLAIAQPDQSGGVNLQLSTREDIRKQLFVLERIEDNARVAVAPSKKASVASAPLSSEITAYPNPFVDKVYLNGLATGVASVQVRDALGQLVWHQRRKQDRKPLELGGLTKGIYYMTIEQADKKVVLKLIKD